MTRSLEVPSLGLLKLIEAAGKLGIDSGLLLDAGVALPHGMTRKNCSNRLTNLRISGYAEVRGRGRGSRWYLIGGVPQEADCSCSKGHRNARQRQRRRERFEDDSPVPWNPRPAPKGVPPGVPNSVWALAPQANRSTEGEAAR